MSRGRDFRRRSGRFRSGGRRTRRRRPAAM